jgi:hypothetical protein
MKTFNPDEAVLIPATVLRMRGSVVEMQLKDGQMVRTESDNVIRQDGAKAVPSPAENKAISGAPENKSRKSSKTR